MDFLRSEPDAHGNALHLIDLALAEDLGPESGPGDLTGRLTIPEAAAGSARFVARSAGVLAGLPVLELLCGRFRVAVEPGTIRRDGERCAAGMTIAAVSGPMRSLLAMERTALNFLQRLGGVATLTARFVAEVAGTKAVILDTRKTTPGWRALEKYAVRCGGGVNHRMSLSDAALVKDNHVAAAGGVAQAFWAVRETWPQLPVEVECDTIAQVHDALAAGADLVLLDNMSPADLTVAARACRERGVLSEASGGLTLDDAEQTARTGVDFVAVGALTHSAPVLDIGLDLR